MNKDKKPQRMCIACREMKDKSELIRFVKSADAKIVLDCTGKAQGRGAYVCNNNDCVLKCIKSKALNRAFATNIDASVYEKLKEEYEQRNRQN